ncbi:ATP-dependent helicase brm-like [Rhizophagus clarus]|uniref:ATP-dependent helicase brm-like n=1 Tax=Rhizophagus clarus TaxID=94130 RepID=A0A8H3L844_9GLOM|nr:ATP-dependent helicase brm-like [Rhizophagus clarus]
MVDKIAGTPTQNDVPRKQILHIDRNKIINKHNHFFIISSCTIICIMKKILILIFIGFIIPIQFINEVNTQSKGKAQPRGDPPSARDVPPADAPKAKVIPPGGDAPSTGGIAPKAKVIPPGGDVPSIGSGAPKAKVIPPAEGDAPSAEGAPPAGGDAVPSAGSAPPAGGATPSAGGAEGALPVPLTARPSASSSSVTLSGNSTSPSEGANKLITASIIGGIVSILIFIFIVGLCFFLVKMYKNKKESSKAIATPGLNNNEYNDNISSSGMIMTNNEVFEFAPNNNNQLETTRGITQ